MDTRSTLPRTASMEDSQANDHEVAATDTWTVRDTVCVMMFDDPALLGPGRMLDLPPGLTEERVGELCRILPGPTEPHDLAGFRKLYGFGHNTGSTLDEFDEAVQQLILSYHDAAAAATTVLQHESAQLMQFETEKKKGDVFMKQLDLLCEKGKVSKEQCDQKRACVEEKLQASMVAMQSAMKCRVADKCAKQLVCVDAVLRFQQLIMDAPNHSAPEPEHESTYGDVENETEFDMEAFEEEFSAFLSISDPVETPAPAVPCKV